MRISDWSSDVCSSDLVRRQSADDPRDRAAARRGGWRERERGRGRRDAGDARGAADGRTVAMTAETPVTVEDDDGPGGKIPLLDHRIELTPPLRASLVAVATCVVVCPYFDVPIFGILAAPPPDGAEGESESEAGAAATPETHAVPPKDGPLPGPRKRP